MIMFNNTFGCQSFWVTMVFLPLSFTEIAEKKKEIDKYGQQ